MIDWWFGWHLPSSKRYRLWHPSAHKTRWVTAICAVTHDRLLHAYGGQLCHLVLPTPNGSLMRSGFLLGDIEHRFKLIHSLLGRLYNLSFFRKRIIKDQ